MIQITQDAVWLRHGGLPRGSGGVRSSLWDRRSLPGLLFPTSLGGRFQVPSLWARQGVASARGVAAVRPLRNQTSAMAGTIFKTLTNRCVSFAKTASRRKQLTFSSTVPVPDAMVALLAPLLRFSFCPLILRDIWPGEPCSSSTARRVQVQVPAA